MDHGPVSDPSVPDDPANRRPQRPDRSRPCRGGVADSSPVGRGGSRSSGARRYGARIKVTLAAVIATAIARALQLPVPSYATLAAVTAVEITLRVSMVAARNAIVGAAAGALIGLGLAEVAKDGSGRSGSLVLVPSIIFGLARMEPIARQAALVASVIVLIPVETQLTTPEFAAVRFAETVIGILVALLVNVTVLPPRATAGRDGTSGLAIGHLSTLYRLVTDAVAGGFRDEAAIVATRRSFRSELAQVDALWDEAMAESPAPDSARARLANGDPADVGAVHRHGRRRGPGRRGSSAAHAGGSGRGADHCHSAGVRAPDELVGRRGSRPAEDR